MERYGEKALYDGGIIRQLHVETHRHGHGDAAEGLPKDPAVRLHTVIGILNTLAIDPRLVPSEEAVRSALRAMSCCRRN